MTEPLIVVEGNLRLPTLRALTDPSLNFGLDWSPARTRPVQSPTEYALFAARFETAYVPALSLSDVHSPYRAASLWAVFAKEEIPRAMLNLIQDPQARSPADDTRADPIHLAVGAPAIARRHGFSKPVAAAIAAAGGVLIVWLLFGLEPGSTGNTRSAPAEQAKVRAQPDAVASASAPVAVTTASIPNQPTFDMAPIAASTEPYATPPAATPIATASNQSDQVASIEPISDVSTSPAVTAATTSLDAAPIATAPRQSAQSQRRVVAASATATASAERTHNGRVRAVLAPRANSAAPTRAHAPAERVAKHDATRHARVASGKPQARQTSKTVASLDPTTLYSMLQHSPTLDSNAGPSGRAAANGAR
ncbi:hypothetical protein NK8_21060 [Caballeronia sp. NK8]|uniref:hypothetical protein n=1 Tax=Caballeronia sp. NK8 TaxID=140098 RepID=UPI001BB6ADA8|nr:hypothetical protein [Caballeronia sp. NK8]BCQ23954.1 hypothetical protein NK8_21060 [Caballeronia sp. NK8]